MIRYTSSKQLSLEGFVLPFGGKLNPRNRWVKWSEIIPWDDLAVCVTTKPWILRRADPERTHVLC